MSSERGYIYIASNPSMPGLIKVGKTTTSPNQRMSELHSTGVPTPFSLEFAARVADCHASEKRVHRALETYRVTTNREFFKIEVKAAIERAIGHLLDYEIVSFKEVHGIKEIEKKIANDKAVAAASEAIRQARIADEEAARLTSTKQRMERLKQEISKLDQSLEQLGPRPILKEQSGLGLAFWIFSYPVPIGWITWAGALNVFSPKYEAVGFFCIFILIVGWLLRTSRNEDEAEFKKLDAPFAALVDKISPLQRELDELISQLPDAAKTTRTQIRSTSDLKTQQETLAPTQTSSNSTSNNNLQFKSESNKTKTQSTNAMKLDFNIRWSYDSRNELLVDLQTGEIFSTKDFFKESNGFEIRGNRWANFHEVNFLQGDHPYGL